MSIQLAAAYVGLSVAILRRESQAGRMPAPIRVTPGRVIYLRDQLDAWLSGLAGIRTYADRLSEQETASNELDLFLDGFNQSVLKPPNLRVALPPTRRRRKALPKGE